MVKIIRDFVPKTRFLILCDSSCGQTIAGEVDPPTEEQKASGEAERMEAGQLMAFVQAAAQQGWKIGLDKQTCPQHVRKETGNESRILIPNGRVKI